MWHNVFNERVTEFLNDMISGFPTGPEFEALKTEFRTFKSGFNLLKSMDDKKPVTVFHEYVVRNYRDKILSEDESFFLNREYDITSSKEYWMDVIGKIRQAWALMDADARSVVWKYFKVLVVLCEKCLNGK